MRIAGDQSVAYGLEGTGILSDIWHGGLLIFTI
jgi:hypothetical protein